MAAQLQDALLRLKEVRQATGLSKSTIARMERAGGFPQRVSISLRNVAWRASEIQAFVASRQTKAKVA